MGNDKLSVLVVASEVAPLAQTGGLAEVTGSLPLALRDLGCRVAVAMPAYRQVLEKKMELEVVTKELPVRLGTTHLAAEVLAGSLGTDVPIFFIRRDEFYDRSELYGSSQGDYFDNPERYIFFSRAIPALCPTVGFVPDVILANDWQTGLVMPLLHLGAMPRTAGVFTIHNQGYLGLVPPERTANIGLPDRYYTMEGLEYFGQMSLLKAGIIYSNAVTAVSPTYAREIQSPEFGLGLDGVLKLVSHRLKGILNGVDYNVWNPAADQHLAGLYHPGDLSGKTLCKHELLMKMGLSNQLRDKPVIGMVTRLSAQKGFNLLAETAEDIFKLGVGLIILGAGEERYEELLNDLKARFPGHVGIRIGFDPQLAHEIIAGCDMLLMPSLYEPCGMAQMYGLKYGTVPIVRATGGMNDSVMDPEDGHSPGTGFKFGPFQSRALLRAVRRAVDLYRQPEPWRDMMLAGMAEDFSWDRSAREYVAVFKQALEARRGQPS